jgi:hypothetical protein
MIFDIIDVCHSKMDDAKRRKDEICRMGTDIEYKNTHQAAGGSTRKGNFYFYHPTHIIKRQQVQQPTANSKSATTKRSRPSEACLLPDSDYCLLAS